MQIDRLVLAFADKREAIRRTVLAEQCAHRAGTKSAKAIFC
jgi:hypothetical protein